MSAKQPVKSGSASVKSGSAFVKKISVTEIVKRLEEEIKEKNRKDVIDNIEGNLSKKVEKISKNRYFYNLHLKNIFSVISKADFNKIDENDKIIKILQVIIKKIMNKTFFFLKSEILLNSPGYFVFCGR